jgi:hypothetical protein
MTVLAERALRVAMTGYIPADDPHIIADMQARIDALGALLELHRCNVDASRSVGQCIKAGACGCSCGLLVT